jgi:hypothetical protein
MCAGVMVVVLGSTPSAMAALQPVVPGIADVTPRILVEGGQLILGPNDVVVEFDPARGRRVSAVTVTVTQGGRTSPGALALTPDGPGRFRGRIAFASIGSCRLQVDWLEAAGHRGQTFTLPVGVGHH